MREESKLRNTGIAENLYTTSQGLKRSYCFNIDYGASESIRFKTRVQLSTYTIGNRTTGGMVALQDVSFNWQRFSMATRYALFDTDDYDNRIYVYEQDAYLSFSFPAYYGKGLRNYFLLQFKASQRIDLYARFAHTQYIDRNVIGSAGETIQGNTRNDVKFQARIRL
jgi:hypothetical protein